MLFCFNHPLYVGMVFVFTIVLSFFVQAAGRIWQLRGMLLVLALVSALTWPFYMKGGTPLWSWWIIEITQESLAYGIAMGLRWAGAIAVGVMFVSTVEPDDLYAALVLLKLPYAIAFVVSLTFRLVPEFIGVGLGIIEAQTARGLDLRSGSLFSRFRKLMALLVPFFIHAVQRANLTSVALESRGFNPSGRRTFYRQYKMTRSDYLALILVVSLFLVCLWIRSTGAGVFLVDRV